MWTSIPPIVMDGIYDSLNGRNIARTRAVSTSFLAYNKALVGNNKNRRNSKVDEAGDRARFEYLFDRSLGWVHSAPRRIVTIGFAVPQQEDARMFVNIRSNGVSGVFFNSRFDDASKVKAWILAQQMSPRQHASIKLTETDNFGACCDHVQDIYPMIFPTWCHPSEWCKPRDLFRTLP